MQHVGFSILQPRIELVPPAGRQVLTTGPPKKSLQILAFIYKAAVVFVCRSFVEFPFFVSKSLAVEWFYP